MTDAIPLAPKLDHGAAAPLHALLLGHCGRPVHLDGTSVRGIGGLCAQVLLAAARRWEMDGQTWQIEASEAMQGDLRRLGLAREILKPETTI